MEKRSRRLTVPRSAILGVLDQRCRPLAAPADTDTLGVANHGRQPLPVGAIVPIGWFDCCGVSHCGRFVWQPIGRRHAMRVGDELRDGFVPPVGFGHLGVGDGRPIVPRGGFGISGIDDLGIDIDGRIEIGQQRAGLGELHVYVNGKRIVGKHGLGYKK